MQRNILVDGREFVVGRRTGIGRFLEGLLLAVISEHPEWHCSVVMQDTQALPASLRGQVAVIQAPALLEWFWPSLAQGFDLFLSPYPKLPLRQLPCPCIHTVHDVFYLTHPAYQGTPLRRKAAFWRLQKALAAARLTWFDSQASEDETIQLFGQMQHETTIRYPAIEQDFMPDEHTKKSDFFLFVGNGRPHKNLNVLLAAIEGTHMSLTCVGIAKHITDTLLASYALKPGQVTFLQDVDDVALLQLYRQAIALLQPSTAEGYGYPPLEAFACQTAAIVSDIPVLRETTHGQAIYCLPHDLLAWREAMLSLISDEPLRLDKAKQGMASAVLHQGVFGWQKHLQDMQRLMVKN